MEKNANDDEPERPPFQHPSEALFGPWSRCFEFAVQNAPYWAVTVLRTGSPAFTGMGTDPPIAMIYLTCSELTLPQLR